MKSDEILAEIIGRNEVCHCPPRRLLPDENYPNNRDLDQCPDEWDEKGCSQCWLDWARKKAAESESEHDNMREVNQDKFVVRFPNEAARDAFNGLVDRTNKTRETGIRMGGRKQE